MKFLKKKFFQKKSHSAEKCRRGDPSGFINKHSVAKYQKTQRGDPLGTLKNFRKKVAQFRKKSKGGTLWSTFALGGLGLRCSAQNCKKWTDQCEDCSLKKKKGHCYSRAFFLKRKTRRLKITPYPSTKSPRATKRGSFLFFPMPVFWKISENRITKRLEYKSESFKFTFIFSVIV